MTFSLDITTPETIAAEAQTARIAAIRAECRHRILAVLDEMAQLNLAADAAAGRLSRRDSRDYAEALAWRDAMRARARAIATGRAADFTADAAWPAPDPCIIELAARF